MHLRIILIAVLMVCLEMPKRTLLIYPTAVILMALIHIITIRIFTSVLIFSKEIVRTGMIVACSATRSASLEM